MYITNQSTRNMRHVMLALLDYRRNYLSDGQATGIELQQYEDFFNEVVTEYSNAAYEEKRREDKRQADLTKLETAHILDANYKPRDSEDEVAF